MKIVVCVKQVPDPEVPPAKFRIDPVAKKIIPSGLPPVISVFDAQACDAACRIKDKDKENTQITIISMGPGKVSDVVRHALSMGADEGIILQDEVFEDSDSFGTAHILTKAIEKIGDYDLILCGRQAADWEAGQVGSLLAEMLNIPLATLAADVEVVGGKLRIKRALKDGYSVVETPMPSVVTVSGEIGPPRLPRGMDIIQAASKEITVWTAQDIQVDPSRVGPAAVYTEIFKLFIPVREVKCEIIDGDTPGEAAANLVLKLKQAGAI